MSRRKLNLKPAKDASGEMLIAQGEVLPEIDEASIGSQMTTAWLRESLAKPDAVAAGASFSRTQLLQDVRLFDLGTDAATSISASNSIEKMLAHQMVVAHDLAMKVSYLTMSPDIGPLNIPKLSNAAVRLMEAFQGGVLALHKIKTGGRQTVVVQHVDVGSGGKAVIAGSVNSSSAARRGGGSRESE